MSGEVSVTIALLRAMWRSRDGRRGKEEQAGMTGPLARALNRMCNPVRLVFPPEIIGPAAGDDRGPCFFVLAHGLWVWFAP